MSTLSPTPLLSVRDLRVDFRLDKHTLVPAVKGISFDIFPGETLALVGESGSGKSVSALAMMGLLPPESALVSPHSAIEYSGRDLLKLTRREIRALCGREIAMIFQEPMSSLNPLFRVGEQIAESLRVHTKLSTRAAHARAIELLDEVGIPEPAQRATHFPFQLSGGQQQRVMIAMAMACAPRLLIADEPTTALDVTIQRQIIELVDTLRRRHDMAVLWISHDLAVVGEIADRVVVMRRGEIRETGTTGQIFTQPKDAYTQALLRCRPPQGAHAEQPHRLIVIDELMSATAPVTNTARTPREFAQADSALPPLLDVRKLSKHFEQRDGLFRQRITQAVDDVSFTLPRARTLGLVGESGSGKSTLGLTVMGLHKASAGEIRIDGCDWLALSRREQMAYKRRIQIIFQNPYASLNPRFVVGDIIKEPMRIHGIGASESERERLAATLLDQVGLPALSLRKYPHEFSGGQRQRIAIARALSLRPDVLICDEAVSALDVSVQAQVLNLLQDLQDEFDLAYLFISHDLAVVNYIADRVMVMHRGKVVEAADPDTIYQRPQHPYTQKLLGSIPRGFVSEASRKGW
jgi:peptide/nickel transport system ATP-binding protein